MRRHGASSHASLGLYPKPRSRLPVNLTYTGRYANSGDPVSHTYTSCAIGTPRPDRTVWVAVIWRNDSGGTSQNCTAVSVDGVSLTQRAGSGNGAFGFRVFRGVVATLNSTGDVVVTHTGAGTGGGQGIVIWTSNTNGVLNDQDSWDSAASAVEPAVLDARTHSWGGVIAVWHSDGNTDAPALTGLTGLGSPIYLSYDGSDGYFGGCIDDAATSFGTIQIGKLHSDKTYTVDRTVGVSSYLARLDALRSPQRGH